MSTLRIFACATSILGLSAIVGLANVSAQTDAVAPSETSSQQRWSEKARVTEANRRQTVNAPAKREDRMVCKQEPILGTRLKGMVTCRTAGDWRRISRGFQAELKRTNDKAALAYSSN